MLTTWILVVYLCLAPGVCSIKEDISRFGIVVGHTSFERCEKERDRVQAIVLPGRAMFRAACIEADYRKM